MAEKRKVTTDDLRDMMARRQPMPDPEDLDTSEVWLPMLEWYVLERMNREITKLKREKVLLRAALQEAVETAKRLNGFNLTYTSTWWEERILKRTEDKPDATEA